MNLRIITKNHAVDLKIGSPLKIDFRADLTHESIPTAWELRLKRAWPQVWNFFRRSILQANLRHVIIFTSFLELGHLDTTFRRTGLRFCPRTWRVFGPIKISHSLRFFLTFVKAGWKSMIGFERDSIFFSQQSSYRLRHKVS